MHLYHLTPAGPHKRWMDSDEHFFYPATYKQDGFTHLTENPKLLISVANHFYTDSQDKWLCLVLDSSKLTNEVKYEPAAPVGDKPRHVHPGTEESVFPHLFGGINKEAILEERAVQRGKDGSFISVEGV